MQADSDQQDSDRGEPDDQREQNFVPAWARRTRAFIGWISVVTSFGLSSSSPRVPLSREQPDRRRLAPSNVSFGRSREIHP
jgi:hypothetical protein